MIDTVHQGDNRYELYRDGRSIGCIAVSCNPFHSGHVYLNVGLTEYDPTIAEELFDSLQSHIGKPIQVMLYSNKKTICDFLLAGGFTCKRRCFEVEGCPADLTQPVFIRAPLEYTTSGEESYRTAARMLYEHYRQTHEAISPLTADFETFCAVLPELAVLSPDNAHAAFLEEEEIAYVASRQPAQAGPFLENVLAVQLSKWGKVCFECDDCDPVTIQLLKYFPQPESSYDTYIRAFLFQHESKM